MAHLPFDLSLILYPLTFFASHHDLQGLNLAAESFDLVSLRAEYCLLLALSLLFLLFKVGDSLLKEKELRIELVDLSSCEIQVLAPQGGKVVASRFELKEVQMHLSIFQLGLQRQEMLV
jgi:hypothetical protein